MPRFECAVEPMRALFLLVASCMSVWVGASAFAEGLKLTEFQESVRPQNADSARNFIVKWPEHEIIDVIVVFESSAPASPSYEEVKDQLLQNFEEIKKIGGPTGRVSAMNISDFWGVKPPSIVVMMGEREDLLLLSKQVELSTEFKFTTKKLVDLYQRRVDLCASEILYDDAGKIALGAISAEVGPQLIPCINEQFAHVMGLTGALTGRDNSILNPSYEGELLTKLDWQLLSALYHDDLQAGANIGTIFIGNHR